MYYHDWSTISFKHCSGNGLAPSGTRQIIIAQMSFIHLGQVDIWFWTSVDAMLLVQRTSASQISRQPLLNQFQLLIKSIPWHSPENNFTRRAREFNLQICSEITLNYYSISQGPVCLGWFSKACIILVYCGWNKMAALSGATYTNAENYCIFIQISLKLVPKDPTDNKSALI